ncbi:unnamed protein product [Adineta ricciae]|uniref:DUF4440 domain-containing protein n=1 Tax=Adineta ricciae TaxID=249248 RepID=A0A815VYY1_ADIRI|nr:unnamed protein product [Adineta ricciae]
MSTVHDIISAKHRRMEFLWNSKQLKEMVMSIYTPDAQLFYFGDLHIKGHDEILHDFETNYEPNLQLTLIEILNVSDDYIMVLSAYKTSAEGHYQSIWKKTGEDWKMVREFCNDILN